MIKNNDERIARAREILAASRQELRRAQRIAGELTEILYPAGETAIVRLRSGGAEIGWNTRTPPAMGSTVTRDGRRWTVTSVTVIEEHGYRISARGTGLSGHGGSWKGIIPASSPAPAARRTRGRSR